MSPHISLYRLAFARTGDKGNRANIALVCRCPQAYAALSEQVTAQAVAAHFAARRPSRVVRYDLPNLGAFNFVLDDVLDGGVNASLGLDGHGKTLSFHLLDLMLAPTPAVTAALAALDAQTRQANPTEETP